MENLLLPNLKELFLHRNSISKIENLSGCPRLKKLWLCQNKITNISGLYDVPALEELWLQSNLIQSLSGIENCMSLRSLSVAGNKINSFREITKLSNLRNLAILFIQDIHFGRCPITDDIGKTPCLNSSCSICWLISSFISDLLRVLTLLRRL